MEQEELTTQADPDWDSRVLCSDGRCTGIIGPDGRCKECGVAYEEGTRDEIPHTGQDVAPSAGETACAAEEAVPQDSEPDADWDNRVLCSDGNCIGVIGSDGRCRECGLPLKEG